MILQSISLFNFRNFSRAEFGFSSGATLICGPNASGKSNILEAAYLLASGASLKTSRDCELIKRGEGVAVVSGERRTAADNAAKGLKVIVAINENFAHRTRKKFKVGGVGRKLSDFAGNFQAVLFSPEDINLVTDSPRLRRRYLNLVLSQVDKDYRRVIFDYDKVRKQRNRLLCQIRDGVASRDELHFWDRELVSLGPVVTTRRRNFFSFINSYLRGRAEGIKNIFLDYRFWPLTGARLEEYREREIASGMTLLGPHREDFVFKIKDWESGDGDGRDLSKFGSRGEQRLAVFYLKLAELKFLEEKTGERPTLLLDDIFSELDESSRGKVFGFLARQQTIVTAAGRGQLLKSVLGEMKVINL